MDLVKFVDSQNSKNFNKRDMQQSRTRHNNFHMTIDKDSKRQEVTPANLQLYKEYVSCVVGV